MEKKFTTPDINANAAAIHQANIKWWHDIKTGERVHRNPMELLMLAITELAEALEGARKNLPDDKLPHRKMEEVEMADCWIRLMDFAGGFGIKLESMDMTDAPEMPDNKGEVLLYITATIVKTVLPDEPISAGENLRVSPKLLSVTLSLIQLYCKRHGHDLDGAIEEKMAFNAQREDHTHEARLKDGGKKF